MKVKIPNRQQVRTAPPPEPPATGWVRIPTRGYLPDAPFSRGALYALIKQGKVRTASVPVQGGKRGVRMVWLPSLLALVEQYATGPKCEAGK